MQTKKLATKKLELLESTGYAYSFLRQLYFNQTAKKAFSVDFVQECMFEDLESRILPNVPGTEWQFYFNATPSHEVKRELIHFLDTCKSPAVCTMLNR